MKKVLFTLMCLAAMLTVGTSLKAQEITVTLEPGWNWISYPNTEVMDIASALGDFVPMNGDIVRSRFGSSSYLNNRWRGNVTQFTPGWGYMYYSSRTETTSFVFAQAPSSFVTTAEPIVITLMSVVVGGTVTVPEGCHVFLRGVCWGTEPNPDIDGSHTSDGTGIGSFSDTLVGLNTSNTYYVRAYAVTDYGLAYGEEMIFTTNHTYVDLGLPSGTLWATCNVGADSPEDYGDYFAWGETQTKDNYSWGAYQYCNGSYSTLTKYCNYSNYGYNGFTDTLITLVPEDDAATVRWGAGWRMPTRQEWNELLENTTIIRTTQNGVNGQLFTAANGNSIFLPAAGYLEGGTLRSAGSIGYYWSSSLCTVDPRAAWYIACRSYTTYESNDDRYYGLTVRAVRSSQK